jgi:hypothetical protein
MSFRLFIYYCAAWGAAAAYFGWMLGRLIEGNSPLLGAALKGMALGLFVSLGLVLVDALAVASQRSTATLGVRLGLAILIGAVGGLFGGFVGQACFQLSDGKWPSLQIFGWTLTGILIGAAPASFDYFAAVMKNEERRGVNRKLRNGLVGGAVGGIAGGLVSLLVHGMWDGVFKDTDSKDLWSPSATGFVALGACIGLAVALAQIILRDAWLRVESGFRPGRQLLLTRPETLIGRAESCDVGLFGDAGAEKQHAKIVREGNRWLLVDLGTPSGTLLNGQRITGPTPLHSGDRIQVGGSVLSFGVRTKETAAAAPPPLLPATP